MKPSQLKVFEIFVFLKKFSKIFIEFFKKLTKKFQKFQKVFEDCENLHKIHFLKNVERKPFLSGVLIK